LELDLMFSIGGKVFDWLWMLVDGIYQALAGFVKPISVPIGRHEALFSGRILNIFLVSWKGNSICIHGGDYKRFLQLHNFELHSCHSAN
jgi:hypothetical protein